MRSFCALKARGFTLVELMIVVAIIGVLAALAIFGVRKYLTAAKTAEARNTIGAINRGAVAAYERDRMKGELLAGGGTSTISNQHKLCESSAPTPAAIPKGVKYQPKTGTLEDFNAGTDEKGWRCLHFAMTEPIYYQYGYGAGASVLGVVPLPPNAAWVSEAAGDLNGDGNVSGFVGAGSFENDQPKVSTAIIEQDPDE